MPLLFSLLVIFLLLIVSGFLIFKLYLGKKQYESLQQKFEFMEVVVSASLGGYYYWNSSDNSEIFSENLVKMLHVHREINTFDRFLKVFSSGRQTIKQLVESLKNAEQVRFVLNAKAFISGTERHVHCIGHRIDDRQGKVVSVVVWFLDVTDYVERLKRVTTENHNLKNKVCNYLNILDSLPFPVWQREMVNFDIVYHNAMYEKLAEDINQEAEEKNLAQLYNGMKQAVMDAYSKNRDFLAKRHIVLEEQRKLFAISEKTMEDNAHMVGVAYDITRQEDVEQELARHISAHADLLESSSSAMAVYGRDTKLKFYNNAFVRIGEFDEQWLSANPTYQEILEYLREHRLLPEQADFNKFREQQLKLFDNLLKPHEEFFYLPNGRTLRVIVIPHALGGLLFAYEDVTDRLAMERSYNTLIAVQKVTLDHVSEGLVVYGSDGNLKFYNPKYALLWPKEVPLLNHKPHISELFEASKDLYYYGDDWPKYRDNVISDLASRTQVARSVERKDGKVITRISTPLPDGDTLVSFVDVTDSVLLERSLREKNEALEQADKLKTEFLANVSYEFRTPLTSIMGFAEMLMQPNFGRLTKKQDEYVHSVYESSVQLMSLINDVLDLASIEAGFMTLEIKEFDICAALGSVISVIYDKARQKDISLNLECGSEVQFINGDERRIKQVIFNIVNNSIKFTPKDGVVTVGVNKQEDNIVIWVKDNGIGITELEQNKVFDRFYTAVEAKTIGKSGTGLGLAVVKNIIDLHGGKVILESLNNQGTLVKCILPLKLVKLEKKNGKKRVHN